MHYIRYDVLYAHLLSRLQYLSGQVQHDREQLLKRLLSASGKELAAARKKQSAELKKAEKRKSKVDALFAKMYEDWAAGRIKEYNFKIILFADLSISLNTIPPAYKFQAIPVSSLQSFPVPLQTPFHRLP